MPFRILQRAIQGGRKLPDALTLAAPVFEAYVWGAANLESDLSALVEDWHEVGAAGEPAFENSWVNFGAGEATAAFCKDPWGWIHIKGALKTGTVPSVMFTLPTGYRPPESMRFAVDANQAYATLIINTAGALTALAGSNVLFNINCSFRAA